MTSGVTIEIMFGRLKEAGIATRCYRCPTTFFSAIARAASVIYLALMSES